MQFFYHFYQRKQILFKRIKKLKIEIFDEELLEDVEIELLQTEETITFIALF